MLCLLLTSIAFSLTSVFINEIHYDNQAGDVDKDIEIDGSAGTDLTGWPFEKYNGSNIESYGNNPFCDTIPIKIMVIVL